MKDSIHIAAMEARSVWQYYLRTGCGDGQTSASSLVFDKHIEAQR